MKVLLINPNRYKYPPVPSIGLEYLAGSLEQGGHCVELVDLCFSENVYVDIDDALISYNPDVVGITVRNVDTVLYHSNEFFLDEIKDIIKHIKSNTNLKVIIGGSGLLTNPEGILNYLEADFAIVGPGEKTLIKLLGDIENANYSRNILYGDSRLDFRYCRKFFKVDYKKYFELGGIAGFETHKGCSSSCVYCIEANSDVSFRNIPEVISEIKSFVDNGYNHFHLCDSEFNESLEFSIEFCNALKESGMNIRWAVYMKPAEFSKKLFKLMKETGVYLITLTIDTWKKCTEYWRDIEKFVFTAKPLGLKVAIDLLAGFPYENEEDTLECLNTLRRLQPDTININTFIRLYKTLPITNLILKDPALRKNLLGNTNDPTFIKPIFYNHLSTEAIKQMIGSDPIFRIEGLERTLNYIRV